MREAAPPRAIEPTARGEDLAAAAVAGDRRALARLLTAVENRTPVAEAAMRRLYPQAGRAHLVGITGPPGSGKSTLVAALIERGSRGRPLGRRRGRRPLEPDHRRRAARRPGPDAGVRRRRRRVHPLDGVARPRRRACLDVHGRGRGDGRLRLRPHPHRDGRHRPERGRGRGRGRHDGRPRGARDGRRGPGDQGRAPRGGRPRRRQQGRPAGRAADGVAAPRDARRRRVAEGRGRAGESTGRGRSAPRSW